MADSSAPILIAGGATLLSDYMQGQGVQFRVALATGLAVGVFALLEKADHDLVVGAAWLAMIASLIAPRPNGQKPPVQQFLDAWNSTDPARQTHY